MGESKIEVVLRVLSAMIGGDGQSVKNRCYENCPRNNKDKTQRNQANRKT